MQTKLVYQPIFSNQNSGETVVVKYNKKSNFDQAYQSEKDLEAKFIDTLIEQGYQYLDQVKNEAQLIINLRKQMERLNNYQFSDSEWNRFLSTHLIDANSNIVEKTKMIQQGGHLFNFQLDNGENKNFRILDKINLYNNQLQVINQYSNRATTNKHHRYDVTILVNGLPLVHIELKKRGTLLKEALNQIDRYQSETMDSPKGLFNYVQIFVISNGSQTRYYGNTARSEHLKQQQNHQLNFQSNGSLAFTNQWSDQANEIIDDLEDFSQTFFAKHTLLNILTKYCVFNSENKLLVMRPYQISAVEKIVNLVKMGQNEKWAGSENARGYIWHSTGSGKTLSAFKASQLIKQIEQIDKVIHVVDRQDLDHQTISEYEKFQKGSVTGTNSTKTLLKKLKSNDEADKMIVTTIQKLNCLCKTENANDSLFKKTIIFIFDECHRSQFGLMHHNITKRFKNNYLFGFTGTPIFALNAKRSSMSIKKIARMTSASKDFFKLKTTDDLFKRCLSTYNMVNAIKDHKTLPFKFEYYSTLKVGSDIKDKKVLDINRKEVWESEPRIENNTKKILATFNQKTLRDLNGSLNQGFNAILTCASIKLAQKYYLKFQEQQKANATDLKIAIIYSKSNQENDRFSQNQTIAQEDLDEIEKLSDDDRDFLECAINHYNQTFNTNFSLRGNGEQSFQSYYQDVAKRMKNGEIDLLIVVNMFLTGFDAACVNTLWIDRNLEHHGLIQAISRTNRIANANKTHGNIINFRANINTLKEALSLYYDNVQAALEIIALKSFDEYYTKGYQLTRSSKRATPYVELVATLKRDYDLKTKISGLTDEQKLAFIRLFNKVLKTRLSLLTYDEFKNQDLLSDRERQDYLSYYMNFYDEIKQHTIKGEIASIVNDLEYEIELVAAYDIGSTNIFKTIKKLFSSGAEKWRIIEEIEIQIRSSLSLRSKKQLIKAFIAGLEVRSIAGVDDGDFEAIFNEQFLELQRQAAIFDLAKQYDWDENKLSLLLHLFWSNNDFDQHDVDLVQFLNPLKIGFFSNPSNWMDEKQKRLDAIKNCYEKFQF